MKKLLVILLALGSFSIFANPKCIGTDKDNNRVEVQVKGGDTSNCIIANEAYEISVKVNGYEEYSAKCAIFNEDNHSYSTGDLQFYLSNTESETSSLYLDIENSNYNTLKVECK